MKSRKKLIEVALPRVSRFEDRLESTNPRGPYGAGIAIARRELARNGNPDLGFQVQPTYIGAIVHPAP